MARKASARVVLNRKALTEFGVIIAEGVEEVARTIVEVADPPDATPWGEGLVTRGGWLVYLGPKKIGGGGQDGRQPKKPRAFRVQGSDVIQAIAGWGFPGRFQEMGTVHHAAQPFAMPAADRVVPHAARIMGPVVGPKLRGIGD